jgi:quercetin dioxygenase-like cupin family protein
MMTVVTGTDSLSFLNTYVRIAVAHDDGVDGLSVIDSTAGRGDSPPAHIHHSEDEGFHVIEGRLRLVVDGEEQWVEAGETALAPRGVAHTYRVESKQARWLAITTNGDFEAMVREVSRPAERAELPEPTAPDVEALTAACARHGIEFVGPPLS